MEKQLYCSGVQVSQSGIYRLVHEGHLHDQQELVLLKGEFFPACDLCREGAKFKPIHLAPHICTDGDFWAQYDTHTCSIPIPRDKLNLIAE